LRLYTHSEQKKHEKIISAITNITQMNEKKSENYIKIKKREKLSEKKILCCIKIQKNKLYCLNAETIWP